MTGGDERLDHGSVRTLSHVYQPIIRGYFSVAAIYYAIMTVVHVRTLDGVDLIKMGGVSLLACLASAGGVLALRRALSVTAHELLITAINLLVIVNVVVAIRIEYSPAKLVYFIMIAMIFAFGSVSIRQALPAIIVALGSMFIELVQRHSPDIAVYSFIGFGAALAAVSIAFFLQRAIALALAAQSQADQARADAERRLVSAQHTGETMRRRSLSDSLTGLPNRRAFFDVLAQTRDRLDAAAGAWLILLDLDGFKAVNDNYGHIMGDALLQQVAVRLRDSCGRGAHVSRMGGDEFNIILNGQPDEAKVEAWCERLLARIAEIYLIEDRLIQISGSIGCYALHADEPDPALMQKADYALLHAKRNGKNRVVVFREEHAKDAAERYRIEQALRVADFGTEIDLLFQPQYDLGHDRLVCAEALARWRSPHVGDVAPDRFIRVAEESGLIARITLAVVDKALAALRGWAHPIRLSINLSAHDLLSDQIVDQIIERVATSGVMPQLIEFEVTETAMMCDMDRASANLLRLAAMGHPIALDDFGTGYSNFTYLRTLPIGKLKVDRSFMENIGDPMTEKILNSLVGMARTLDVHCLLEGIENELELLVAKRVGAQSVQGYLFGMPMTAAELQSRFLGQRNAPRGPASIAAA